MADDVSLLMTFDTVFIEKSIADHEITQDVLSRLPQAKKVIVEGRTFYKKIAVEIRKKGLTKYRAQADYADILVNELTSFPEEAVRFVAKTGANSVGTLNRGEVCAHAKSHLFLTYTDRNTLLKPSQRGDKLGTKKTLCCDYVQMNPVSSCPYQCMYCFESDLRGLDVPFMRFYVNYKEMFDSLNDLDQGKIARNFPSGWHSYSVNMGEHADSLAQEHIFGILPEVTGWFQNFKRLRLLLLSKGGDPKFLPHIKPENRGKIALAFSINTAATSRALEVGAPSPAERLKNLKAAYDKGYMVAIRLDPLVNWPENWKKEIEELINLIHDDAPMGLSEITVGTMRFRIHQPSLFTQMINSNFVETPQGGLYKDKADMDAIRHLYSYTTQLEKGFSDNYYRLPFETRRAIYLHVVDLIKKRRPDLRITLCQEASDMYREVNGVSLPSRCNCMVANW